MGLIYTIRSLRVDGDHSADPARYRRRRGAVGRTLVAFLDAHLSKGLASRRPVSWPVPEGLIVAYNPTVTALRFWAGVRQIAVTDTQIRVLAGTTGTAPPPSSRAPLPPGYNEATAPPRSLPARTWRRAIQRRRQQPGELLDLLLAEIEGT